MVEYCGFRYNADGKGNHDIIPNKDVLRPKTFFKYYALTDNSVDALTNMYIYATHPNQFNDPFDCNEKLIEFDSWEDIELLWEKREWFDNIKKCYPCLEDACRFSAKVFKTLIYRKLGLVSLAPIYNNYLMWALYAQNSGFCVEFDVSQFPFRHFGPFPINYVKEIPYPIHISITGGSIAMLIQSNVKNSWWKYEDEWRLYIPNPNGFDMKSFGEDAEQFNQFGEHDRKFKYPLAALRSVILGKSFFDKLLTNPTSLFEIDVICHPEENLKEKKVLDFLANLQRDKEFVIKIMHPYSFSDCIFIPIQIVKYSENKYRIVEHEIY